MTTMQWVMYTSGFGDDSCFHIMKPMGQIKDSIMVCPVYQVASPGAKLLSTIAGSFNCATNYVQLCDRCHMICLKTENKSL